MGPPFKSLWSLTFVFKRSILGSPSCIYLSKLS